LGLVFTGDSNNAKALRVGEIIVVVLCVVVTLFAVVIFGLFHGYLDHGQFDIKHAQWSSSKQVAMVVERSDRQALGGLTNFVVVGNHLFTADELRHVYHSDAVIFAATTTCLDAHWESSTKLIVACKGSTLDSNHIDVQKEQSDGIAISYENISIK
jgi:hypothetical protein